MNNIFAALLLGIALAGVSFAQSNVRATAPRLAVVEFTADAKASAMNDQAKRNLQSALAASLNHTRKFDVYDTRHTRNASQADLTSINGSSTAAAVKVGKQLGVALVATGTVVEYNTGGSAIVKVRLIEVATGRVKYSGQFEQQATMKMTAVGSAPEMQAKVMKPLIEKVTGALTAAL